MDRLDPDIHAALEDQKCGGPGIYQVKKRMDLVEYEYKGEKNCLTLKKKY